MLNKIMKRGARKLSKTDPQASPVDNYRPSVYRNVENVVTLNSSSVTVNSQSLEFEVLPMFREVAISDRQSLFLRKLQICSVVFDFSDASKSAREKETKKQTLLELIDFVQSGSGKITEYVQEELIKMISINIFRCLPPTSHENTGSENTDPDEEEQYMDPSWSHLQFVYELLFRYIVSSDTDTKIAKRCIDHSFVLKFLDLFDSEDPREREYLKTILHRIYGKFMVHRPFIRKVINNIFYRFIFETERHSGIAELLEILGSIINGFALPMKEEHKLFLVRALLPLHKPKSIGLYHPPLSYCITQFVEKDYKLADIVIRGLLKYWPVTNCQKEVLFLNELEEILEATQSTEFHLCMIPLFRQIGRCLNSSHFQISVKKNVYLGEYTGELISHREADKLGKIFDRTNSSFLFDLNDQVAERAFYLWNNEHIMSLISQNRNTLFPIIFESLEKNLKGHWNQAIFGLTTNVRKILIDMDKDLFEDCQTKCREKEAIFKELQVQREMKWRILEAEVAAKSGSAGDDMVLVNF